MKKNILRFFAFLTVATTMPMFTACNPEPDDSDLFTATGETVADFIMRKPEFSSFVYILNRVGLDRNLSTYGEYTCYDEGEHEIGYIKERRSKSRSRSL